MPALSGQSGAIVHIAWATAMDDLKWFQNYRMEWIGETLRIFGFINREHIQRKFGISTPQASLDLRQFMTKNPCMISYDKSTKRYVLNKEPANG